MHCLVLLYNIITDICTVLQEVEDVLDPERERGSSKQTLMSNVHLDKLSTDGTQLVTNIAVAGDSKEVSRRMEEEEAQRAR